MSTIRELITEKSEKLRDVDVLGPDVAAEELVALSSLLSSLNKEIADAHFVLNQKKKELIETYKTVAKAKLYAEATEEWKQWFDRVMQAEALNQMIQAVKYYLKGAERERMNSRYN